MNSTNFVASLALAFTVFGASTAANAQQLTKPRSGHDVLSQKSATTGTMLVAGPVSRVNTSTAGYQELRVSAALDDGGFLFLWESSTTNPADGSRFDLQRFDSAGRKVGGQVRIGLTIRDSSIAVLTNGDIVVAYRDARNAQGERIRAPSAPSGVFIQKFDASGAQILRETSVATTFGMVSEFNAAGVVALADGGYVVQWLAPSAFQKGSTTHFYARTYDGDGHQVGNQLALSTSGSSPFTPRPLEYTIQAAPNGGFLLYKTGIDATNYAGCFGSRSPPLITSVVHYDQNLVSRQILAPTHCAQVLPLTNGTYMLFNDAALTSQLLDPNGALVGLPKPIDARVANVAVTEFVARTALADGSYLLIWYAGSSDFKVQRYASNGDAIGEKLSISGYSPAVLALTDGDAVRAWTAVNPQDPASLTDVFMQRLSDPDEKKNAAKKLKRQYCRGQADDMKGQARKAFMDRCLGKK